VRVYLLAICKASLYPLPLIKKGLRLKEKTVARTVLAYWVYSVWVIRTLYAEQTQYLEDGWADLVLNEPS